MSLCLLRRLTSLFALFVFLLCRLTSGAFTIDSSTPTLRKNLNEHRLHLITQAISTLLCELKKGFISTIYHQFIIHSTFFFFNDYFSFTKMNVVIISFIFFCLSTPSKSQHIHIILFSFFFAYISSIIFSLLCYSVYS
jgi:hypothetical protein